MRGVGWQRSRKRLEMSTKSIGQARPINQACGEIKHETLLQRAAALSTSVGYKSAPPTVALDQLRTVDAERLLRRLGRLTPLTVTLRA